MPTPSSLTFGPFEFNTVTFRLVRAGVTVPLEPKAIDVLRLLLERAPGVVEKSEIFAVVWKDVAVTDNALTRVVAQLRRALDDDARSPTYIETVATRGYRMAAEVRAMAAAPPHPDAPPGPAPVAHVTEPVLPRPHRVSRRGAVRWAGIVGVVACAVALLLLVRPVWWQAAADESRRADGTVGAAPPELATAWPVQLTTGAGYDGMAAFSPDGTAIAYASDRSGSFEIYVQQLVSGGSPMPLTSNGRQNVQPAWSPDGKFITFHEAAGGGIWIVPSRGGTARRVVETGSRPACSPDGSRIDRTRAPAVPRRAIAVARRQHAAPVTVDERDA